MAPLDAPASARNASLGPTLPSACIVTTRDTLWLSASGGQDTSWTHVSDSMPRQCASTVVAKP